MTRSTPDQREGVTPLVDQTLRMFMSELRAAYGDPIVDIILFGSRAWGDARPDSDADVAVVLTDVKGSAYAEKLTMADLAYDAIVATGVHVQPWPVGCSIGTRPTPIRTRI